MWSLSIFCSVVVLLLFCWIVCASIFVIACYLHPGRLHARRVRALGIDLNVIFCLEHIGVLIVVLPYIACLWSFSLNCCVFVIILLLWSRFSGVILRSVQFSFFRFLSLSSVTSVFPLWKLFGLGMNALLTSCERALSLSHTVFSWSGHVSWQLRSNLAFFEPSCLLSSSPSLALLSLLYYVVFVAAHVCIVKTHFKWLCQLVIHFIVIPLTRCWRFNNAVPPWYQDGLSLNTPLTLVGECILWAVLYHENCIYNSSLPLPCSAFSSSFLLSIFLLLYSIVTLRCSLRRLF